LLITQYRNNIKTLISESGTSLYRTDEDPKKEKAFLGLDFRKREPLAAQHHSQFPFILQADISRFFYTAYTHSIPWAVVGKDKVKNWLQHDRPRLRRHWSNKLDIALQSCQSRETFGIPVGPDTSRLIAEILLAGVESDSTLKPLIREGRAFRLLDDFTMGFMTETDARRTLTALRSALWKYNLQLNDDKTKIAHSQRLFREKWKLDFEQTVISGGPAERQLREINRLVDLALYHCAETATGTPAVWACRRLLQLSAAPDNFAELLDTLFRLARDFPVCVSYVAVFLINNQARCSDAKIRARIKSWMKYILLTHLPQEHHFEVSWCLLVAGVLRIKLEKDDIPLTDHLPGSVVFSMLGLLSERHLLGIPLAAWKWRAQLREGGESGSNWLPFYEAVRRNWTSDAQIRRAIRSEPVLDRALAANVSFLEDRTFEAGQMNITRRVFKRRSKLRETSTSAQTGIAAAAEVIAHRFFSADSEYDVSVEDEAGLEQEDFDEESATEGYL